MKSHRIVSKSAAALLLGALATLSTQAATLYWDTNGTTAGIGGSGTWDTSTANWATVSTGLGAVSAWSNTTNAADIADFRGTGTNAVTVDAGGIRAGGLSLNGGNYTFSGGALTFTTVNAVLGTGTGGNVTIDNNLVFDTPTSNSAQSFILRTASATTLNINGNISFNYTTGTPAATKTISLQGNNANAIVNFSGSVTNTPGGTATSQLQVFGSNGSVYNITGDNSALNNSTSGQVVRGTALLGHAKAMGNNSIQIGVSSTGSGDTAALLTNNALTITNSISAGGANAASFLVVGGNTAQTSTYSGTINGGTGAQNLRLSAAAGGRVDFSNSLLGSGTGLFITQGAGIVALTRTTGSTYTRNTEVQSGTLLLSNTSGSATGTTNTLTVANGATLAGTGFSSSAVVASGATASFSPGAMTNAGVSSLGTLTLSGGLTASSGATYNFDVNGASADTIAFGTGALTLGGTQTFNFTSLGAVQTGSPYSLFSGSGTWSSVSSTYVFNAPSGYVLDTTYGGGNGYIFDAANHAFTVQFASAVPEPSAFAALAGLGALGAVALRRRRRA